MQLKKLGIAFKIYLMSGAFFVVVASALLYLNLTIASNTTLIAQQTEAVNEQHVVLEKQQHLLKKISLKT